MTSIKNKDINEVLKCIVKDGTLSCAEAFKIVNEYNIFPDILGIAVDNNKIKFVECQLGLFGHGDSKKVRPAESVSEDLEDHILEELADGKISCASTWGIANKMKISKFEVACACEKLKIKIIKCQLGAFSNKK